MKLTLTTDDGEVLDTITLTAAAFADDVARHPHGVLAGLQPGAAALADAAEADDDDRPPTYHGIMEARCHTCGFTATTRSDLEVWNDGTSGECLRCEDAHPFITWTMADGTVRTTRYHADGRLETWRGPDPTPEALETEPEAAPVIVERDQ